MPRLLRLLFVAFSTVAAVGLLALWPRSARRLDALVYRSGPKSFLVLQTYPHGLAVRRDVGDRPVRGLDAAPEHGSISFPAGWSYQSGAWRLFDPFGLELLAYDDVQAGPGARPNWRVNPWPSSALWCFWQPPPHGWHGVGFEWSFGTGTLPGDRVAAVYVPFATVVPLALLPLAVSVARGVRRHRRRSRGRCPACDYDLRGSPGRCPECGAVTPSAAAAAA